MLTRRHRDRLEEFVKPQAGAPDYEGGEMGAAVDEPGGPSSGPRVHEDQEPAADVAQDQEPAPDEDDRPAGNASTEDWQEYARTQGATDADLEGLSRNELRDKYGA